MALIAPGESALFAAGRAEDRGWNFEVFVKGFVLRGDLEGGETSFALAGFHFVQCINS